MSVCVCESQRQRERERDRDKERDKVVKSLSFGLPGGSVVDNPPDNAERTGSIAIPDPGISYMPWSQLSPCTTPIEPVL